MRTATRVIDRRHRMYIIIVGGGKVGYHLAKELMDDGHEILVIENDEGGPRTQQISDDLGSAAVLLGDGCEATTLESAGAARADMLIAATGDDEDNLVACQVAKHRCGVPRTVARVNNPRNEALFRILGVDVTVSATAAILGQIEQELPTHRLVPLLRLPGNRRLEMVELRIPDGARVVGCSVRDVELPEGTLITLIVSPDGTPHLPADTTFASGSEVIAITRIENEAALRAVLTEP